MSNAIFLMLGGNINVYYHELGAPNSIIGLAFAGQAISIGLFFVSIVAFVPAIVPAQLRQTGQSLIHTFYAGEVALGNILTGLLDNFISVRTTM